MEAIKSIPTQNILELLNPTIMAFIPLLEKNREKIEGITKKTFQYGATERHQLDVYFPPTSSPSPKVLFWAYGGGFVFGDRVIGPPPRDLAYGNLGSFYAQRGYITIIPDYRLVPHVTFPGQSEDIRDAIQWTLDHPDELGLKTIESVDLIGHSAGSINIAIMLLLPGFVSDEFRKRIKSVVLSGATYHDKNHMAAPKFWEIFVQYWGSEDAVHANSPFGLLEKASQETAAALPRIAVVEAEHEPELIATSGKDFKQLYREKMGKDVPYFVAQGHNHISMNWALNSGEGEQWAEDVVAWLEKA
ncbi:alpha/beta-hydrolase [Flagelloscypha sp. PMI_526]|nr:alpha/beta-hydrolase [Flagelloscypha sp. PMI_526]